MKRTLLVSLMVLFVTCTSFAQSMVKDLSPGIYNTFILGMGELNGKLYFLASVSDAAVTETSLFKSDGTESGTVKLKSGLSGYAYSNLTPSFFNVNGRLLFYAADVNSGNAGLWCTDGTETGTIFLASCTPQSIAFLNGTAYFLSFGDLWKTDGTVSGTVKVAETKGNSYTPSMAVAGGHIFFQANAGTGFQVWISDGTTEGTKLLKNLDPANASSGFFLENFVAFNGKVYFMGYNPALYRRCIAVSDGTESGTNWVFTNLIASWLIANSSNLFIFEGGGGNTIYVSNGSNAAPAAITASDGFRNNAPSFLANNLIYAVSGEGINQKLFRTDGTKAGTFSVKDSLKGNCNFYGTANNHLYFSASTAALGSEMYSSDGTAAGTTLIKDIFPGKNDGALAGLLVGGTIYFQGNDAKTGQELWKYQVSTSDVNENTVKPRKYDLSQNYPNPFNPSTKISYSIPENGFVTVKVYNVLGKEIVTLVNGYKAAGTYNVQFNAADLPSGIYLCRIEAGNFTKTQKMSLLK